MNQNSGKIDANIEIAIAKFPYYIVSFFCHLNKH